MIGNSSDDVTKQLAQLNDGFLRLYREMTRRFDALEAKVDAKADADRVYTTLDGIAKRLDTDDVERAAVVHQLDRNEGWIKQVASATKTKLVPEQ